MSKRAAIDLTADRAKALALVPVSDNAIRRLDVYAALLLDWQRKFNLVADSTLQTLWTRHIADSLQLIDQAPQAKIWIDFGSGAGFPGLPVACALAQTPGAQIHLVESNGKKAAFLREAVRLTGAPAQIHAERVEKFGESFGARPDVVTARAFAPLKLLCDQAHPFIAQGATGLFLKGRDAGAELTEAAKYWKIQAIQVPSRTDPEGCVVVVRGLAPNGNHPSRESRSP